MIRNFLNIVSNTYKSLNEFDFDNVDPNLVRYFRNEFGKDWKSALTEYLNKTKVKNDKKAA